MEQVFRKADKLLLPLCISPQRAPQYDLLDLPQRNKLSIPQGRRGPDSRISASLQQAKDAESAERTGVRSRRSEVRKGQRGNKRQ